MEPSIYHTQHGHWITSNRWRFLLTAMESIEMIGMHRYNEVGNFLGTWNSIIRICPFLPVPFQNQENQHGHEIVHQLYSSWKDFKSKSMILKIHSSSMCNLYGKYSKLNHRLSNKCTIANFYSSEREKLQREMSGFRRGTREVEWDWSR